MSTGVTTADEDDPRGGNEEPSQGRCVYAEGNACTPKGVDGLLSRTALARARPLPARPGQMSDAIPLPSGEDLVRTRCMKV